MLKLSNPSENEPAGSLRALADAKRKKSIGALLARIGALVEDNPPTTYPCRSHANNSGIIVGHYWHKGFKYEVTTGKPCPGCLERRVKCLAAEKGERLAAAKTETGIDEDDLPFGGQ